MTGRNHAGENMADILAKRRAALDPTVQMCDALSRNLPKDFKVILANCLAHARCKFVDVEWNFAVILYISKQSPYDFCQTFNSL